MMICLFGSKVYCYMYIKQQTPKEAIAKDEWSSAPPLDHVDWECGRWFEAL